MRTFNFSSLRVKQLETSKNFPLNNVISFLLTSIIQTNFLSTIQFQVAVVVALLI